MFFSKCVILIDMPSIYLLRQFFPGSYYHVYNRGAHKQNIFHDNKDYLVFTQILSYYILHPKGKPSSILNRLTDKGRTFVEAIETPAYILIAYCLMPNHFHFMLRQDSDEITISNLMSRLCTTYAMYYNHRYHHSGTIFQGKYKNVLLETEYQWLYLTKYIHRNPTHLKQRSDLCLYPYSSYQNYLGNRQERWVNTSIILSRYSKNPFLEYKSFVEDGGDVGDIERLVLDAEELQD